MKNLNHPIKVELTKLLNRVEFLIKQQEIKLQIGPEYTMITNKELVKLFDINSGTATNWREKGILPYVTIEKKLYYKISDIKSFIDLHYSLKKKK